MAGDFSNASKFAAMVFESKIAPLVCEALRGGRVMPCEGQLHRTLEALDMAAGIDYIHEGRAGCRGLAVRIQVGPLPLLNLLLQLALVADADTRPL